LPVRHVDPFVLDMLYLRYISNRVCGSRNIQMYTVKKHEELLFLLSRMNLLRRRHGKSLF
jgi:hypothetical protein